MTDLIPIRRALVSVSDKEGLVPFVRGLVDHGIQIVSTGGTARALVEAGLDVTSVDQLTGYPEMMDGRVKTLHPRIHGGLLALRDNPGHVQAMIDHGIEPIDLVCINLYPFEQTIARQGVRDDEAIEQIDIGGPSMIRSAAKNHRYVAVMIGPSQYELVRDHIRSQRGATTLALRARLAAAAFARTASYDATIAQWMSNRDTDSQEPGTLFPDPLIIRLERQAVLRYGENPHQAAALYAAIPAGHGSVINARQLHGKQLSFNNLNDAAAALELVKEFSQVAVAVIKHTNPCGLAVGTNLADVFDRAYAGDPLAAFGGIVAMNRPVDADTAQRMVAPGSDGGQKFLEVVIAPDYTPAGLDTLRGRWKNVRLLAVGHLPGPDQRDPRQLNLKSIAGGMLAQQDDVADMSPQRWQHVAGPVPGDDILQSLHVAWCAVKHVKSNAVVIVRDAGLIGAGAGQMDRVESCKIAVAKATVNGRTAGAVAASDAFFPFRDGPDVLIGAGVIAIVQPGGSKRDDETITACNEAGVSLLLTGRRHFRH